MPRIKPLSNEQSETCEKLFVLRKCLGIDRTKMAIRLMISMERLAAYESKRSPWPPHLEKKVMELYGQDAQTVIIAKAEYLLEVAKLFDCPNSRS